MKTGQIFSHVRWINKKFQCRHNAKKNWARLTTLFSEIENATLQKWNIIVLSIYTQQDCCFLYTCFKIREINDCEKRWHAQTLVYTLIVFAILSVRKMVTYYWLQTFDLVANSNLFIWVGAGGLANNLRFTTFAKIRIRGLSNLASIYSQFVCNVCIVTAFGFSKRNEYLLFFGSIYCFFLIWSTLFEYIISCLDIYFFRNCNIFKLSVYSQFLL